MHFREPTEIESSFYEYFHEALKSHKKELSADFYIKCAEFLRANVQSSDEVSGERLSIEDLLLNVIDRHPQPGLQTAYDDMLLACESSFSPKMRDHIQSDPATRLKREVQWQIHNTPEPEAVRQLVQKIYDVAVAQGEVSSYVVGGWMPAPESPFIGLLDCLPEDEQALMKAKLLEAVKVPEVLNHMLFHSFCLRESKRNPSGTNLLKRGKLTIEQGLAIVASGRFGQFMSELVTPTSRELQMALERVRASSYGPDVFLGHFKEYDPAPSF